MDREIVVVTGAASGIGLASARAFAAEGARVHLVDIDGDRLQQAVGSLAAEGASVRGHVVDCRDAEAVEALAQAVLAEDGRVDVLHNNAGVGVGKRIEQTTLDDWRWLLDVNLYGVIHGVHAFLPHMLARGRGTIVNTASVLGLMALPGLAPYCTSKFAVVGMSEALDLEVRGRGVRVLAVCPGLVATEIVRSGRLMGGEKVASLWDRHGVDPDVIGRDVVRAVRRGDPLVVTPGHARVLTGVRRLSRRLQRRIAEGVGRQLARLG